MYAIAVCAGNETWFRVPRRAIAQAPALTQEASRVGRARTPHDTPARSQAVVGPLPGRAHAHSRRAAPPGTARPRHGLAAPRARRLLHVTPSSPFLVDPCR